VTIADRLRAAGDRLREFEGWARRREIVIFHQAGRIPISQVDPIVRTLREQGRPANVLASESLGRAARWRRGRRPIRLALLQPNWRTSFDELAGGIAALRAGNPGVHIALLDYDAPTHIKRPEAVALADTYVKKQLLMDTARYWRGIRDTTLVEYESQWDARFRDLPTLVVDEGLFRERVVLGWNFATHRALVDLLQEGRFAGREREVGVHCRIEAPSDRGRWYGHMRGRSFDAVRALARAVGDRHAVLCERIRVPQREFYNELARSRICVSPFGYGEVCWRDFEAIACGALLVKPDVSHLETEPNIFRPGETYVPVRWDFSDLTEVCARYLEDEAGRLRIVENATAVWFDFLRSGWFECWSRLAERVGIEAGRAVSLI
jgi:GNAT superfamily N-acetyltransferase